MRDSLDPLQFANQAHIDVEDTIIYLLHRAHPQERPGVIGRALFFDLSSVFNTIQPPLLTEKLSGMQVDKDLMTWITEYLTNRPQAAGQPARVDAGQHRHTLKNQAVLMSLYPLHL